MVMCLEGYVWVKRVLRFDVSRFIHVGFPFTYHFENGHVCCVII